MPLLVISYAGSGIFFRKSMISPPTQIVCCWVGGVFCVGLIALISTVDSSKFDGVGSSAFAEGYAGGMHNDIARFDIVSALQKPPYGGHSFFRIVGVVVEKCPYAPNKAKHIEHF